MTKDEVKQLTKNIIKKAFFHYFYDKPKEDDTQQLPLGDFFPQERKVSSLMTGLSTSLGKKLWEELAVSIARSNGFEVKDPRELMQPDPIPPEVSKLVDEYVNKRENGIDGVAVILNDEYISKVNALTLDVPDEIVYKFITKGEGADLLLKKDNKEYAFDIKTVQINAGSGIKFNKTILKWYAYRYHQMNSILPNYSFEARMVFPYNPYKDKTWWEKSQAKAKPLTEEDVFVEDEFWSFLSGLDKGVAWAGILDAFNELVNEGFNQLYQRAFSLKGKIFKAVLFTDRINCDLLTSTCDDNIDSYKSIAKLHTMKCRQCNEIFERSIGNIINKKDNKHKCPGCSRVFMNDFTDLY